MGLDESVLQNVREDLFVKPGDVYNRRLVKLFLDEHASLLQADESSEPRFDCDWMNEPPQLRLHTISGAAMSSKCFLAVFWIAVVISPYHSLTPFQIRAPRRANSAVISTPLSPPQRGTSISSSSQLQHEISTAQQ